MVYADWVRSSPPSGRVTSTIGAINSDVTNENSTLTYIFPVCEPSDTLLRLNGQIWCDTRDPPGNDAYLDFSDLHVVHDNRYGEGLNTMWIYLDPRYNYLLAQGVLRLPLIPFLTVTMKTARPSAPTIPTSPAEDPG